MGISAVTIPLGTARTRTYADYHPKQVWSLGRGMGNSTSRLLSKGASSAKLAGDKDEADDADDSAEEDELAEEQQSQVRVRVT